MAEKYVQVRTKLQDKIFTPYGISASLSRKTGVVYNERGEIADYGTSSTDVTVVPYDIFTDRFSHMRFGNQNEGDMDMATPWDTNVESQDEITYDAAVYKVTQIEKPRLKEHVVTLFRMSKTEDSSPF